VSFFKGKQGQAFIQHRRVPKLLLSQGDLRWRECCSRYKDRPIFNASNAVDGMDSGLFSHTADRNVWWEVDLNGTFEIDQVLIKNRYCGGPFDPTGCLCRLSHSSLVLLSEEGKWVDGVLLGNTCGELEVVHDFAALSSVSAIFLISNITHHPPTFLVSTSPAY
jgi:hypothetical protein